MMKGFFNMEGEICKAAIYLEMAASRLQVVFYRQAAIKLSGMSDCAYSRSFNTLQSSLGVKSKLNIKELAIQFGCIRMITIVQKGLSAYKERYLAPQPVSRRANTDFTRPVFIAAAFYLCAKKQKVMTSMMDLCFDFFGVSKEKKDPKQTIIYFDLMQWMIIETIIANLHHILQVCLMYYLQKRRHDDSSEEAFMLQKTKEDGGK